MFNKTTLDAFCDHVREMRKQDAQERKNKRLRRRRQAVAYEEKLEALERQAIAVWRCVDGRPVEIIHRR